MQPRVTVELDVVIEAPVTLAEAVEAMCRSRSYVDIDRDRTACCGAEEVWDSEDQRYECDLCGLNTRPTITNDTTEVWGPNWWSVVQFRGPKDDIEHMLVRHGYEDGLETYIVGEEQY